MAKKLTNLIGSWAFLLGIILAVVSGILIGLNVVELTDNSLMIALMVIGILIGLFNVTQKESTPFLLSGTVLIIASSMGASILMSVPLAGAILLCLLIIFVPATIIVAIRNVFNLSKN